MENLQRWAIDQKVNQLIQILVRRNLRMRGEILFVESDSQLCQWATRNKGPREEYLGETEDP